MITARRFEKIVTFAVGFVAILLLSSAHSVAAQTSPENPIPLGEYAFFGKPDGSTLIRMHVLDIWRGNKVKQDDTGRRPPQDDTEYVLVKIEVVYDKGDSKTPLEITYQDFSALSEKRFFDSVLIIGPDPVFEFKGLAGSKASGWIALRVNKDDKAPLLVFDPSRNGTSNTYFALSGIFPEKYSSGEVVTKFGDRAAVVNADRSIVVRIKVLEVVRGADAIAMIVPATPPPDGMEYLLAKVEFKVVKVPEPRRFSAYFDFRSISQAKMFRGVSIFAPKPVLDFVGNEDQTQEGWVGVTVFKSDPGPFLVFGADPDNQGGAVLATTK